MKLDINLAREPFRSYRTLHLVCAVLALAGLTILGIETWSFADAMRSRSMLSAELARINDASQREQRALSILASYVEPQELKDSKIQAAQVSTLIERRIFDWDKLFHELEALLPNNVRLEDLHPQVTGNVVSLSLDGAAKSLGELNALAEALEKSDLFDDVFINDETSRGGEVDFSLRARYVGAGTLEVKKGPRT